MNCRQPANQEDDVFSHAKTNHESMIYIAAEEGVEGFHKPVRL